MDGADWGAHSQTIVLERFAKKVERDALPRPGKPAGLPYHSERLLLQNITPLFVQLQDKFWTTLSEQIVCIRGF
jgi:hypothetical protein